MEAVGFVFGVTMLVYIWLYDRDMLKQVSLNLFLPLFFSGSFHPIFCWSYWPEMSFVDVSDPGMEIFFNLGRDFSSPWRS